MAEGTDKGLGLLKKETYWNKEKHIFKLLFVCLFSWLGSRFDNSVENR